MKDKKKFTEEMKEKRERLKAMSRPLQQLVKAGAFDSVNAGLVELYASQGHTEIHSFLGWLDLGFCVKKGEKALLLWGAPRQSQRQETEGEEADEFSFWPVAYVFSQLQVEPSKNKNAKTLQQASEEHH